MAGRYKGLRTQGYKVNDLKSAREWYSKVVGIEPYFDEPFYVGFNVGGYELGLQASDIVSENKSEGSVAYWGVDDVHETYKELLLLGATSFENPADVGDGIIVAAVKDPWGNPFGIIYNPHFNAE